MEVQARALGPARTNFNDYVGAVAADDAEAVWGRPSLYELAKIDRDRYTVLGSDLRVDGSTTASIYAIDRVEHRISLNGNEPMRSCGTTNCLDQLAPRSSRPQRAGEINTRLQITRLPAPSILDAPKWSVMKPKERTR